MNISIKCQSLLLDKTLSIFLRSYSLSNTLNNYDVIISDKFIANKDNVFIISNDEIANMKIPFSKKKLIDNIKHFYEKSLEQKPKKISQSTQKYSNKLEDEISVLMQEYTKKIISTMKKYK